MTHLGYPAYFMVILGVWKVLGGVVVVAPRLPRLKEWAYAGMLFDLTGAAASHAAVGDPVAKIATPLILMGIVAASWALRPGSRKLSIGFESGIVCSASTPTPTPRHRALFQCRRPVRLDYCGSLAKRVANGSPSPMRIRRRRNGCSDFSPRPRFGCPANNARQKASDCEIFTPSAAMAAISHSRAIL